MIKKDVCYQLIAAGAFLVLSLFCFILDAHADTVYLKNGRAVEGVIKSEDENRVELEIGFGVVGFNRKEIERIYRATPEETLGIHEHWGRQKEESARRSEARRLQEELLPKHIEIFQGNGGQLVVNALLNKKVQASLILDTGASIVMLSRTIALQLGLDIDSKVVNKNDILQTIVADGRKVEARHFVLESISVQGMEAKDVDVAVISDPAIEANLKDGLLGMSFLKNFSFKIDAANKKLILEKSR
ncbi:MAG: retropepsin-like aspartic protease [Candidatus Omnitrophota bacterium]|jgi:clan AA aspartic protease (TIGR02281 family)